MLARSALHTTSKMPTCPSCQARKVPSVTQITHTKASTITTEAMAVSSVDEVTPEPAWNAASLSGCHGFASPPIVTAQRRKGSRLRPLGVDVILDALLYPRQILAQPVIAKADARIRLGLRLRLADQRFERVEFVSDPRQRFALGICIRSC